RATCRGAADNRTPSASPSEWAGSVETRSRRRPRPEAPAAATLEERAKAQAQVVLPTPPLPAKKTRRLLVRFAVEAFNVDAGDLVLRRHRQRALLRPPDLAECGEHVALDLGELGVGHLTELELHLGLEQPLAERRVVVHLRFGGRHHLVEHEPE